MIDEKKLLAWIEKHAYTTVEYSDVSHIEKEYHVHHHDAVNKESLIRKIMELASPKKKYTHWYYCSHISRIVHVNDPYIYPDTNLVACAYCMGLHTVNKSMRTRL